jgi:hypothetical protein
LIDQPFCAAALFVDGFEASDIIQGALGDC